MRHIINLRSLCALLLIASMSCSRGSFEGFDKEVPYLLPNEQGLVSKISVKQIVAELKSTDKSSYRRKLLGALALKRPPIEILESDIRGFLFSADAGVAYGAFYAYANGTGNVLRALDKLINSGDGASKRAALEILRFYNQDIGEAKSRLRILAQSGNESEVRQNAVYEFAEKGLNEEDKDFILRILDDPDPKVAAEAFIVILNVQWEYSFEAKLMELVHVVTDGQRERITGALFSKKIAKDETFDVLTNLLQSKVAEIRLNVLIILMKHGRQSNVTDKMIIDFLESDNVARVVELLAELRGIAVSGGVSDCVVKLEGHEDSAVRDLARWFSSPR